MSAVLVDVHRGRPVVPPDGPDAARGEPYEAGTAPGDRKFRPDVHGLRAVAILLVVLYHADASLVRGGFVGVDVFFVISGFVITGVLLRESSGTGRPSLLHFYARRAKRILPAATLVILTSIVLAFVFLGSLGGLRAAVDGKWAVAFFANVHYSAQGTNYLASQQLPSLLQNYWSLSVEEQFYLLYPAIFLVVGMALVRYPLRLRLTVTLAAVIVTSFLWSALQTGSNPVTAYFSPFTRAWELAIGALVAVSTRSLARLRFRGAAAMVWAGLAMIVASALTFSDQTAYPGTLAAIPVLGAAFVIAGGAGAPAFGPESLLRLKPFDVLGKLSYSLYLWHWPILVVAAESAGKTTLPVTESLGLVALAVGAAAVTYVVVENPVRRSRILARRPGRAVLMGVALILVTLVAASITLRIASAPSRPEVSPTGAGSSAQVAAAVRASNDVRRLPADLTPNLQSAPNDRGYPPRPCSPTVSQVTIPACIFGDAAGHHTMVLYGDSHALMWFQAVDQIAKQSHWRLAIVGKGYCMANKYSKGPLSVVGAACRKWQQFAYLRIRQLHPDLVVVTQEYQNGPGRVPYTPAQWQAKLERTMSALSSSRTSFVVLGNLPAMVPSPPDCLAEHTDDVQTCSTIASANPGARYNKAEARAVASMGGRYIDVTPWFCATHCSAVIGKYEVYLDQLHVTRSYSLFLEQVLAGQLALDRYP